MKLVLRLEELGMLLLSIVLLYIVHAQWWWYLLMFLGPDVSMVGYLFNNKVGAWCYNLFHHKGFAIVIFLVGLTIQLPGDIQNKDWLINLGIILFGHSSMDRFFGYGLKYENGFKFTHLGEIGKK